MGNWVSLIIFCLHIHFPRTMELSWLTPTISNILSTHALEKKKYSLYLQQCEIHLPSY
jgi:hypothetical protein